MLAKDPLVFCPSITLINDDIFKWECEIVGPQDSPYQGGVFIIQFEFPAQYPFKAPNLNSSPKFTIPAFKLSLVTFAKTLWDSGDQH